MRYLHDYEKKDQAIVVKLTRDIRRRIENEADRKGFSMSAIVRDVLANHYYDYRKVTRGG